MAFASNDKKKYLGITRGSTKFVKFAKKIDFNNGSFYNFQLNDKVDGEYVNYSCQWWCSPYDVLNDGDKVKVLGITKISPNVYNGKTTIQYTLDIQVIEKANGNNYNNNNNNQVPQINDVDLNKTFSSPIDNFEIKEDDIQF